MLLAMTVKAVQIKHIGVWDVTGNPLLLHKDTMGKNKQELQERD